MKHSENLIFFLNRQSFYAYRDKIASLIIILFTIILFFFLDINPAGASQNYNPNDSIIEAGVEKLMENFFESFTISDERGNYDLARELKFIELFDKNAVICNFLPGTKKMNQNISLDEYLSTIRTVFQDKIIRPGIHNWHIYSLNPISDTNEFLLGIIIQKRLFVYDQRSIEVLHNIDLELNVRVYADIGQLKFKILDIRNQADKSEDISIRFLHPNRVNAKMKSIEFEYDDPVLKKRVVRKRVTDNYGMVYLSGVPEKSKLKIYSSDRHRVILPVRKTAGQWNSITPANRFLLLSESPGYIRNKSRHFVSAGTKYSFTSMSQTLYTDEPGVALDPSIDFTPSNEFFLQYQRMFFNRHRLGVSAGTGLEFNTFKLSVSNEHLVYFVKRMEDETEVVLIDTLVTLISGEKYNYTGFAIPFILSLNYFSYNRFFAGVRVDLKPKYLILDKLKYDIQPDNDPYPIALAEELPEMKLNTFSGKLNKKSQFAVTTDLALLFNLYKDILHLQYIISYNIHQAGERGRFHTMTEGELNNHVIYTPFFSRYQLNYKNFSMGMGIAYRF